MEMFKDHDGFQVALYSTLWANNGVITCCEKCELLLVSTAVNLLCIRSMFPPKTWIQGVWAQFFCFCAHLCSACGSVGSAIVSQPLVRTAGRSISMCTYIIHCSEPRFRASTQSCVFLNLFPCRDIGYNLLSNAMALRYTGIRDTRENLSGKVLSRHVP